MTAASPPRADLDVADVAALLGVERLTVWRWVRAHRIGHYRVGRNVIRFRLQDVQAFLDHHQVAAKAGESS